MPTSAAGNKAATHRSQTPQACGVISAGFTLVELMVVVALIAIATAGASLALRDGADSVLDREAQRLAAVLESARAQARASDAPALALLSAQGWRIAGLVPTGEPQHWLSEHTRVLNTAPVVLGPEPLIPRQQIGLRHDRPDSPTVWVVTDGLQPFRVVRQAPMGAP